MPLSRELAAAIVLVVETDSECFRRINSSLHELPFSQHYAGGARNFGFVLEDMVVGLAHGHIWVQPTPYQDDFVCYGIRDATVAALSEAVKQAKSLAPLLEEIKYPAPVDTLTTIAKVTYSNRSHPDHTATKIVLADNSEYVFDWWSTLNIFDPLIYPSEAAFQSHTGAVDFASFTSFP